MIKYHGVDLWNGKFKNSIVIDKNVKNNETLAGLPKFLFRCPKFWARCNALHAQSGNIKLGSHL